MNDRTIITLDGDSLTIEDLERIARNPSVRVRVSDEAISRIEKAAALIDKIRRGYEAASKQDRWRWRVYGVTTGFGEFKDKDIPPKELLELQRNILLSHSAGVGENTNVDDLANYYAPEVVRAALATRVNAFAKGNSGVRVRLVNIIEAMLNEGVIPLVPLRGSVGASGDLCPLSHLFATLLGHGRYYVWRGTAQSQAPRSASELPALLGFDAAEMKPTYKEGLALTNGANFSSALLALGVHDARILANTADVAAAMTLEALAGRKEAFDKRVHQARPHTGQVLVAERISRFVAKSSLIGTTDDVQDAYSLRCSPQVHGASRDAIEYAATVARCEINSATDNPLFFPESDNGAFSAGNFHGQPIALAADFLTIAIAELASISERRTQMLLDGHHNRNLPPNLTTRAGVNSGFMIAQYTAAGLVSENKVLSHPASVDSIPTSANTEDHVSMSTHAARKMRTVLGNAQSVTAIELLAAAQALEWRLVFAIPAKHLSESAKKAYRPGSLKAAMVQKRRFDAEVMGQSPVIAKKVAPALRRSYLRIRELVTALDEDRQLDEDIRLVRESICRGELTGER